MAWPLGKKILIGRGEVRAHAVIADIETDDGGVGGSRYDPGAGTPGDELRIVFCTRNELEHLLRGIGHEHGLVDAGHCYNRVRRGRCVRVDEHR